MVVTVSVALLMVSSPASAAETTTLDDNIFKGYNNQLDDGSKSYYYLDVTANPQEEGNVGEAISDFFTGKALENKMVTSLHEMKNMLANFFFRVDVFITTAMINGLEMAFNHDVIDQLINDKIESFMRGLVGVNASGGFTNGGLIGSFMPAITVCSVLFALYLFVGKRAQIGAFKSILSTILVLALAAGFFANYGSFLKGMNQVSTGLSEAVLIGPTKAITMSNQPMDTVRNELFAEIWDQFVHRPYLYMQYGTDDVNVIGQSRINELLKMKPGEQRLEYIQQKEVIDNDNINMTYENVDTRLVFTGVYSFFNFINGFPFLILMIALIATQYWFLAIACIAPFAFAWAAFPNQISVLKRFGFHLSIPLIAKILITLATFIYFMISELVYSINASTLGGYITSGFSMLAILVVFVLLWKPIKKIFGPSREFNFLLNEVREFKQSATQHMSSVTRLAGTVTGAVFGGAQGAAIGSEIGGAIGEDVQKTKESYNPKEKVPTGEIASSEDNSPVQNDERTPLVINDWRGNNEEVADLPEESEEESIEKAEKHLESILESDSEMHENQDTEPKPADRIELVELPPLEEDAELEEVMEEAK